MTCISCEREHPCPHHILARAPCQEGQASKVEKGFILCVRAMEGGGRRSTGEEFHHPWLSLMDGWRSG